MPAELLEAAFGLPRCVAMLLSCVIVLRLLIALAAEVCWRSKCAQAAACGHEGTLEQLSAGCRRLRMASGRPGAARCLSLSAIYNKRNGFDAAVPCPRDRHRRGGRVKVKKRSNELKRQLRCYAVLRSVLRTVLRFSTVLNDMPRMCTIVARVRMCSMNPIIEMS